MNWIGLEEAKLMSEVVQHIHEDAPVVPGETVEVAKMEKAI